MQGQRRSRKHNWQLELLEPRHLLAGSPLISEFQASNNATIKDGDGRSSDWIEVYNPTDSTIDLNGWYLTDDASELTKWQFPSPPLVGQDRLNLEPGEQLLVFASGQDGPGYVDAAGYLHTTFKLAASGEFLGLIEPDGQTIAHAYAPMYPAQTEDASYGVSFDVDSLELIAPGADASYVVPTAPIDGWEQSNFDASEWASGETGIGYENSPADYAGLIETTVPLGTATVYLRQGFEVASASDVDSLVLWLRYDDGFVAHLNGQQVASDNAPSQPRWDSYASGGHPDAAASRFVEFDLSEFTHLLTDGQNTLAIQSLNTNNSSDMLIEAKLMATTSQLREPWQEGVMERPTPGQANTQSFLGFVSDARISEPHGFFTEAFTTTLTSATPGATIVYTTDGSEPSEQNGTRIQPTDSTTTPSGNVNVDATVVLRAIATKAGYAPSKIATRTYIFPADVAKSRVLDRNITTDARYASLIEDGLVDIPSISLSFDTPINNSTDEQRTSVEWLSPEGEAGFQIDAGIRAFGGEYTEFAKKNFRLYFRSEYGAAKLEYPLFHGFHRSIPAAQVFDQLNLRTGSHDMVMRGFYMSNRFTDDTMLDMGQLAPHGRFVHVYLNGTYWGQYHLRERWNADMLASYGGGNDEDYESINGNLNVGGWSPGEAYDGDGTTWTKIKSLRRDFEAIRELLDVENYIDYMLLYMAGDSENEYRTGGTSDGTSRFQFFLNDADGWLRTVGDRTDDAGPGGILGGLVREGHPDFMMLLADRIQKMFFNDGVLTPERSVARLQERLDEVEKSFIVESARWGYRSPRSFEQAAQSALTSLLPNIADAMITRLRARGYLPSLDTPRMSQQGGHVGEGFQLRLSADTTKPQGDNLAQGRPATQSTSGFGRTAALAVNGNLSDFSHTARGDLNPSFEVDLGGDTRLDRIIVRNRRDCCGQRLYNIQVEIRNAAGEVTYVSDVANPVAAGETPTSPGSRLSFAMGEEGAVGRYVRINKVAANGNDGTEFLSIAELEAYGERLAGGNEPGIYYTRNGIDPRQPGGQIAPEAMLYDGPIDIAAGDAVKARAYDGAVWSALNEAKFGVVPASAANLRITEIHYNPRPASPAQEELDVANEEFEFLELQNISESMVDLTDVRFAQSLHHGQLEGIRFHFAPMILPPGETVVVAKNQAAFASRYGQAILEKVAGEYAGKLANAGELLSVYAANGEVIQQLVYDDEEPWPTQPDGSGPSLEIVDPRDSSDGPAAWQTSSEVGGSPGKANSAATLLRSDLNGDDEVGFADFLLLSANFGKVDAVFAEGDINGDDVVSFVDFLILSGEFGKRV